MSNFKLDFFDIYFVVLCSSVILTCVVMQFFFSSEESQFFSLSSLDLTFKDMSNEEVRNYL